MDGPELLPRPNPIRRAADGDDRAPGPASLVLFESPARLKHRTDMSYWLHQRLRNFLTSDAPNPSEADNMNAM